MKHVIYVLKDHKKINGTLFYSFEYFVFAKNRYKNTSFIIYNASPSDLEMIKNLFKEKYNFDQSYLDSILSFDSVHELYKINSTKNLILDIHSFQRVFMFLKGDIICYSNEAHEMIRSHYKKITYFGYYDYQTFDTKEKLKFNFDIFSSLSKEVGNKVFVSSLRFNYKDFELPEVLKDRDVIYKLPDVHHQNLFNSFDTLFYYHSDPDTNNRLIPECFYYGKKIFIEFNGNFQDSIYLRYTDISHNGLSGYTLTEDDKMISEFLS